MKSTFTFRNQHLRFPKDPAGLKGWKHPVLHACLATVLSACGLDDRLAGGSIDIGNSITGCVVDPEGRPVAGARVSLFPSSYRPFPEAGHDRAATTVTDSRGRYRFLYSDAGTFNLVAIHPGNGFRALGQGLRVKANGGPVEAGASVVRPPGAIRIALTGGLAQGGGWLYLPGTGNYAVVDSAALAAGGLTLDSVAAGRYAKLYLVPQEDTSSEITVSQDLVLAPAETVSVGVPRPKPSVRQVIVNTTASGAGVSETVADFPLLVRLDAGVFNFSRAGRNGAGIRFTKLDSVTPLPFAIEGWDSAQARAEVWVRLDTVRGDDSTAILMHAGTEEAGPGGPGPSAFDTAAGFAAVWHMDPADDPAGPVTVANAADRALRATAPDGPSSPRPAAGVIGGAFDFDGADDFLDAGNPAPLALSGAFSMSAWVRLDGRADSVSEVIVGKFNREGGEARGYSLYLDRGRLALAACGAGDRLQLALSDPLTGSGWKLLTGTYDGSALRLYENGTMLVSMAASLPPVPNAAPVNLGRTAAPEAGIFHPHHNLRGALDEIRIERRARPAEWIRLSWETQRPDARAVSIR